jgi:hypothetical protein
VTAGRESGRRSPRTPRRPWARSIVCTHVDDHRRAVRAAHEVVRSVPTFPLAVLPVQPERLRADPNHPRIESHQQRPDLLQPRLAQSSPSYTSLGGDAHCVTSETTVRERHPRTGPSHSPAADAYDARVPLPRTTTRCTAPPPRPVQPSGTPEHSSARLGSLGQKPERLGSLRRRLD